MQRSWRWELTGRSLDSEGRWLREDLWRVPRQIWRA